MLFSGWGKEGLHAGRRRTGRRRRVLPREVQVRVGPDVGGIAVPWVAVVADEPKRARQQPGAARRGTDRPPAEVARRLRDEIPAPAGTRHEVDAEAERVLAGLRVTGEREAVAGGEAVALQERDDVGHDAAVTDRG